jgi:8-oxo-dGTP diphosphatase
LFFAVEKLTFLWYNYVTKLNGGVGMTEVVAALIWNREKFMICQRPAHKARGLLWEFVGGKVEPGETKEQALIRECREELAVILSVGDVFMDVVHEYPDLTVHLTLFNATISEGVPVMLEHNDIQWITPSEISNYEFCPADEEILVEIIERYGNTV